MQFKRQYRTSSAAVSLSVSSASHRPSLSRHSSRCLSASSLSKTLGISPGGGSCGTRPRPSSCRGESSPSDPVGFSRRASTPDQSVVVLTPIRDPALPLSNHFTFLVYKLLYLTYKFMSYCREWSGSKRERLERNRSCYG